MQVLEQATAAKLASKKGTGSHIPKIGSSQNLDLFGGDKVSGPNQFDKIT